MSGLAYNYPAASGLYLHTGTVQAPCKKLETMTVTTKSHTVSLSAMQLQSHGVLFPSTHAWWLFLPDLFLCFDDFNSSTHGRCFFLLAKSSYSCAVTSSLKTLGMCPPGCKGAGACPNSCIPFRACLSISHPPIGFLGHF